MEEAPPIYAQRDLDEIVTSPVTMPLVRRLVIDAVAERRDQQERKYPLRHHGFPRDLRMEILAEEVGEVATEAKALAWATLQTNVAKAQVRDFALCLRGELLDVAAVAVRWAEMLERDYHLTR